jgi:NAD(P)-dependent dehydrogenase (short-subunit alcohol dehydrogenase family)
MKEYYQNKVAVVTGGASGIGLALCETLLSLEAKRVVIADVNENNLKQVSSRLEASYPGQVMGIRTDVSHPESVAEMIGRAAEYGAGQIHFLFNNAGLGLVKAFDQTTDADWKTAFDVNFYGALYGIRAVLPIMRAQGGGHIANTASANGYVPMAQQSMYCATKAALIALSSSLRAELWDENIRVSTVIPGTVVTPIWDKFGGAPEGAITPAESAHGILTGIAANERIVIVTEIDRKGAATAFRPDLSRKMDEYLLKVARQRRRGQMVI